MPNITAAYSTDAPFSGIWNQAMTGWTDSTAPTPNVGSIDDTLTGLIALGNMAACVISQSINPPFPGLNVGACIIAVGPQGALQDSIEILEISPPSGGTIYLDPAVATFVQMGGSSKNPSAGGYATWVWVVPGASTAFVSTDVTGVLEVLPAIDLTGQAAGNAGTDVLLTWTVQSCADTTFTIYQNGVALDPVLGQPTNGIVVSQLSPDTAYQFSVVGDVSGPSNTAAVTTGCFDQEVFNCDCAIEPVYQTLAQMRTRIMIRLGYPNQAASPPPGMSALVDAFLYDAQKLIWKQLSRAGLNVERFFRWVMVPGQRYYGIAANADADCGLKLDPYKITWAGFEDLNRAWYRLTEGIPPEYYTRANINFGWPTHYEVRSCIELFPAPQAPYTLWIKGDFGLAPLVADDDTATIDDQAVFLLALGMAKQHYGQRDGAAVLAQADTYIRGLVAGLHGTRRYVPRTKVQNPATPPRFLPLGDAQA